MTQNIFNRMGNQIMSLLLRSPLHGLLSRNTLLITVMGRKSGKSYTTPVNYVRLGNALTLTSLRERTWWRNLIGGSVVGLCLGDQDVTGWGTVVEDERSVTADLYAYFQQAPQIAKYFGVSLDASGQPNSTDVGRTAHNRVVIHIALNGDGQRVTHT